MTNYQILHNTRWITKDIPLDVLEKIAVSIDSGKDCEIIRSGYFKKVLKYTHNQASFYIKQYTTRHFRDAIKSVFSYQRHGKNGIKVMNSSRITCSQQSQLLWEKRGILGY